MLPARLAIVKTGRKVNLACASDRPLFSGCQTLSGVIKYSRKNVDIVSTQTYDKIACSIDWVNFPPQDKDNRKTLLIFPGLTGSTKENYVLDTIKLMRGHNYKIGVYRYSLFGDRVKTGRIRVMDEVYQVMTKLKEAEAQRQIECVGFSNGANQILHYVGRAGKQSVVQKLVIISCPFDILKSSEFISPTSTRLLTIMTVRSIKPLKDKFQGYGLDWQHIQDSKTLKEVDDRFSRVVCDFPTVEDYYRETSSSKFANNVSIPVLAIHSRDDSFCPIDAVPIDNDKISFLVTNIGGHNGFVTWNFDFWFLRPIQEFLTKSTLELYPN